MSVATQSLPTQWFLAAHQHICTTTPTHTSAVDDPAGARSTDELADYLSSLLVEIEPDLRRASPAPHSWWATASQRLFTFIVDPDFQPDLQRALHFLADQIPHVDSVELVLCPLVSCEHDLVDLIQPAVDDLSAHGCQVTVTMWDPDDVAHQALAVAAPANLNECLPITVLPEGQLPLVADSTVPDPHNIHIGALATILTALTSGNGTATAQNLSASSASNRGATADAAGANTTRRSVGPAISQRPAASELLAAPECSVLPERPVRSAAQAFHRCLPGIVERDAIVVAGHLSQTFLIDHWLSQQTDPEASRVLLQQTFSNVWTDCEDGSDCTGPDGAGDGDTANTLRRVHHRLVTITRETASLQELASKKVDSAAAESAIAAASLAVIALCVVQSAREDMPCL